MTAQKRNRVPTLVGIEPARESLPPLPDGGRLRRGPVPQPADADSKWWSTGTDPALYGLFVADGEGYGPARRTRVRGRMLNAKYFVSAPPGPAKNNRSSLVPEEPLPQVGSVLEKFRLDELLGIGGFAAVYRATHLLLKRQVAVKLLRPSVLKRKPELISQLPREAELAARLDHPNVVRMIDVFHGPSGTFLVMEYVEGRSLASLLRRRTLKPHEVVDIGLDVVRGLRAGQEKGLIHRDIKPGNIMVTHHGTAKIVDFGLALCFSEADPSARAQVVGTRGYVAPEQVSEPQRVDFRADIFSLGATLYHAALGSPPFEGDDSGSGLGTHKRAPVNPQRVVSDFPASLSRLLTWMLAPDRAERPSSYELLEQAMERVRSELTEQGGGAG